MLISIIIPVYNVKSYLSQCLDSVLKCDLENCEIIIVDDGSDDGCYEVCEKYGRDYENIKVIHQSNQGLSGARNTGIENANGEYLCFVDSDDLISYKTFNEAKKELKDGYDLLIYNYDMIDNSGTDLYKSKYLLGSITFNNQIEQYQFIINEFLLHKIGWEAWGRFFKSEYIYNYNLRFTPTNEIFAEDLLFSLQYLCLIKNIKILEPSLIKYRSRSDSIMANNRKKSHFIQMLELASQFEEFSVSKLNDTLPDQRTVNTIKCIILKIELYNSLREDISIRTIRNEIYENQNSNQIITKINEIISSSKFENIKDIIVLKETLNILGYLVDGNYLKLIFKNRLLYLINKS